MTTKIVYQTVVSGLFLCETDADESPEEPGHFHIPGGAVETPPPESWPGDKWPRWNGAAWELVTRPTASIAESPLDKLKAFLSANPDVEALLNDKP
ncbi:phage tail protein [Pigmentiphaga sp. CHJ604]|uniref:phage tail protein n=1 Tax=Pigmentiphaga sp. CHJ604 TaxID=3081984 RepID=UPI0030CDE5F0